VAQAAVRGDVAIQLDCFASLAVTENKRPRSDAGPSSLSLA